MDKAVHVFQGQLQGIRTGRATPGLVDSIRVDNYGSPTPLKQKANVSVTEPQQILIR
ncbi:MAG: ribosome recycling factor, partial [Gimesia chilikensis]